MEPQAKKEYLGFSLGSAQHNVAVFGGGNEERYQKNTQADDEIICTEGVAEEKSDLAQHGAGLLRQKKEQDTQGNDNTQWEQCDDPVESSRAPEKGYGPSVVPPIY